MCEVGFASSSVEGCFNDDADIGSQIAGCNLVEQLERFGGEPPDLVRIFAPDGSRVAPF